MLKDIFAGPRKDAPEGSPAQAEFPDEVRRWLSYAHGRAPLRRHLEIALGALRIGEQDLLAFTDRCLADSDSKSLPLKALHRPLATYFLARYFLHALELDGAYAECGVFRGTSALALCRAARTQRAGYGGERLHLIDSFEGLDRPVDEDLIDARGDGGAITRASVPQGSLAAPVDVARHALREFPAARIHQGWIPGVFGNLPETTWAFVHIDVDQYAPTRDCLAYFHPRLCPGGVIICDDYGAPLFPGARRAWDQFCERHDLPFVMLDTGQSVILKA